MKRPEIVETGFSLVELSIVLVILGLLTGGILSGQSLIRASEIRSLSSDISRYQTATYTFRDKYFALPGDMRNAVKFWTAQIGSSADGVDATCAALTTAATGRETCNGNGDGSINGHNTVVASGYEIFRAWQHLANAGFIEGSYGGVGNGDADASTPGVNVPTLRVSNGGASFWSIPSGYAGDANWFPVSQGSGNVLLIGAAASGVLPTRPLLKPEEAWNIDTKMDDGKPAYGTIVGWKLNSTTTPNCTTSDTNSSAEWNILSSSVLCNLNAIMR